MRKEFIFSTLAFLSMTIAADLSITSAAETPETIGRNPSVSLLMTEYGLSQQEAQMRIDLQDQIIAMSEKLNIQNDPAYADIYIQHDPVYKIIVSFSDKKDRKAFLEQLDPKLRRHIQLKNVGKSRGDVNRDLEAIAFALKDSGVAYTGGYDLPTAKFQITVETEADSLRVKNLLPPNLKNIVQIEIGPVPKTQATPYGVKAGDTVSGGTKIYTAANNTSGWCTLGYAVNYNSGTTVKRGILTSAHCPSPMYFAVNGAWVTLHTPIVEKQTGKYDYQIWETTGLASNNRIYYRNLNSIPEFPASGSLSMTTITTFMNQKVGMVVCKSGATTGITCGKIIDGNALYNGATGWIKVSHTNQIDISEPGDSGGPWFLYPGTSTTISGVGVHTAGSKGSGTGSAGYSFYMPIDYIDDHIASVNTVKQ